MLPVFLISPVPKSISLLAVHISLHARLPQEIIPVPILIVGLIPPVAVIPAIVFKTTASAVILLVIISPLGELSISILDKVKALERFKVPILAVVAVIAFTPVISPVASCPVPPVLVKDIPPASTILCPFKSKVLVPPLFIETSSSKAILLFTNVFVALTTNLLLATLKELQDQPPPFIVPSAAMSNVELQLTTPFIVKTSLTALPNVVLPVVDKSTQAILPVVDIAISVASFPPSIVVFAIFSFVICKSCIIFVVIVSSLIGTELNSNLFVIGFFDNT